MLRPFIAGRAFPALCKPRHTFALQNVQLRHYAARRAKAAIEAPAGVEAESSQAQEEEDDAPLPKRYDLQARPANKPELVTSRPSISTFVKPGFPKDLLRWLREFPHALLLVRVGQFYESYFDQAIEIADLLKIRLTTKSMESKRYPMCGFPIAQMDKYLEKLVKDCNKFVAICEETKHYDKQGNMRNITRKVVRVVTPGTLIDETFIEKQTHNYLLAIDCKDPGSEALELAWIDTSTGELFTQKSTLAARTLTEDLARISPAEIVLSEDLAGPDNHLHPIRQAIDELETVPKISFPVKRASQEELADSLEDDAEVESGFSAIPLLADYISETLLEHQPDLTHPLRVRPANTMKIDRVSLKALEIRQNNDGGRSGTLISVLDRTVTSAGMRLLSDRIVAPSKSIQEIESRHALVAIFQKMPFLRDEIVARLRQLDDEVRLLQKMSIGRPTAEDLLQMAKAIRVQTDIKAVVDAAIKDAKLRGNDLKDLQVLKALNADLSIHDELADKIEAAIDAAALDTQKMRDAAVASGTQAQPQSVDETEEEDGLDVWNIPIEVVMGKAKKSSKKKKDVEEESPLPATIVTKTGKPPTVLITWGKQDQPVLQADSSPIMAKIHENIRKIELRARRLHNELSKQMQAPGDELLFRVVPRFGPILRIGWKKTHSPGMRETLAALDEKGTITLVRKAASARYFAHNHWTKLNSEMQGLLVQLREAETFAVRELCSEVLSQWHTLRRNAAVTAELDVATALSKAAQELNLVRPTVHEDNSLNIEGGRHPVAEFELAKQGRSFVANHTELDHSSRLHVITGPNMGGKSTVLRQVGIIAAMAQAGSFVPATKANIGIVDQLFARIRYSDNIARGRSSFRVEMDDAAYLLENATNKSLVLLDEFGRGTTADYAACIAEATISALVNDIQARSLFATHLHDIYDILQEEQSDGPCLRDRVTFLCTQLAEEHHDEQTSLRYLYTLVPGVNRDAAAFKVAQLAGYPQHLLQRAERIYEKRNGQL